MSTELVLILTLYAFILLGVFLGDRGPIGTFRKSTPILAAKVERNITTGRGFAPADDGGNTLEWKKPEE